MSVLSMPNLSDWSIEETVLFLERLGLASFSPLFRAEQMTGAALALCTATDLQKEQKKREKILRSKSNLALVETAAAASSDVGEFFPFTADCQICGCKIPPDLAMEHEGQILCEECYEASFESQTPAPSVTGSDTPSFSGALQLTLDSYASSGFINAPRRGSIGGATLSTIAFDQSPLGAPGSPSSHPVADVWAGKGTVFVPLPVAHSPPQRTAESPTMKRTPSGYPSMPTFSKRQLTEDEDLDF